MGSFKYSDIHDSIINVLKLNNTTGSSYNLNNSITTIITDDNILYGHINTFPIRADRLPMILISFDSKEVEMSDMGWTLNTKKLKKIATAQYNIFTVVGSYGGWEGQEIGFKDIYNLTRNIEYIIDQNVQLSNTVMWCNVQSAKIVIPESEKSFAGYSLLTLIAKVQY